MVVTVDTPDRRQLALMAGDDPAMMRFLESLFQEAGTLTPTQIKTLRADIDINADGIATNAALIAAITGTQAVSQSDSPYTPTGSGTLLCDATDGPIVIAMNPATVNAIINVKKIDEGENAVTLTPSSGTIDGSATAPITTPFLTLTAISNGTDWFII